MSTLFTYYHNLDSSTPGKLHPFYYFDIKRNSMKTPLRTYRFAPTENNDWLEKTFPLPRDNRFKLSSSPSQEEMSYDVLDAMLETFPSPVITLNVESPQGGDWLEGIKTSLINKLTATKLKKMAYVIVVQQKIHEITGKHSVCAKLYDPKQVHAKTPVYLGKPISTTLDNNILSTIPKDVLPEDLQGIVRIEGLPTNEKGEEIPIGGQTPIGLANKEAQAAIAEMARLAAYRTEVMNYREYYSTTYFKDEPSRELYVWRALWNTLSEMTSEEIDEHKKRYNLEPALEDILEKKSAQHGMMGKIATRTMPKSSSTKGNRSLTK